MSTFQFFLILSAIYISPNLPTIARLVFGGFFAIVALVIQLKGAA